MYVRRVQLLKGWWRGRGGRRRKRLSDASVQRLEWQNVGKQTSGKQTGGRLAEAGSGRAVARVGWGYGGRAGGRARAWQVLRAAGGW